MLNVILMFSSIHRPTHNMTHCGSQASLKPMPNHWCPMHDATHGCLVITWTTEDAGSWITCSSWVATVVSESCVKWFVSEWIAKTCGIQTLIWKNFWRRTRHSWNIVVHFCWQVTTQTGLNWRWAREWRWSSCSHPCPLACLLTLMFLFQNIRWEMKQEFVSLYPKLYCSHNICRQCNCPDNTVSVSSHVCCVCWISVALQKLWYGYHWLDPKMHFLSYFWLFPDFGVITYAMP